jgi:hypothetical protein
MDSREVGGPYNKPPTPNQSSPYPPMSPPCRSRVLGKEGGGGMFVGICCCHGLVDVPSTLSIAQGQHTDVNEWVLNCLGFYLSTSVFYIGFKASSGDLLRRYLHRPFRAFQTDPCLRLRTSLSSLFKRLRLFYGFVWIALSFF